MADRASQVATRSAAPDAARLKLQTSLGNALIAARGHGAPETSAAFARANELSVGVDDPLERLSAHYGLWVGSLSRAEADPLRAITGVILRDIEHKPPSPEVGVAHRLAGVTDWYLGHFASARAHVQQALDLFDPLRDSHLTYRFGQDLGVSAMTFLAFVLWSLGEIDRARAVGQAMVSRAAESGHTLTVVYGHFQYAVLNVISRNPAEAAPHAEAIASFARENQMQLYSAYGGFLRPWALWYLGKRDGGLNEMRQGIGACHDLGNALYTPLFETALAEVEAEAGEIETALASVDRAIVLTERTGQRWNEADTHRVRGEILLKRDPANTSSAEEAFLTAIAIAQQQKARSFELRAALSLAKLYQASSRAADADAVLAPALKGVSPTPEFTEIEVAQKLLAVLAATDEVKNAAAWRQRRLKLQTSYGQALLWSKGFGAAETKAAFNRAKELAADTATAERFPAYYGLFIGGLLRGELASARETAEIFLREASKETRMTEVAVANRNLGMTCLFEGNFVDAQAHLERSLAIYDAERDREVKYHYGWDNSAGVPAILAPVIWLLGDVGRGRELMEEAVARAAESDHEPTAANTYFLKALFEMLRGDAAAVRSAAETVTELGHKLELPVMVLEGDICSAWARARLRGSDGATTEIRLAIAAFTDQGNRAYLTLFQGRLAELEAERESVEKALARIDEALALADQTGEHWCDSYLYRTRGGILLRHDPLNMSPAEEAFLAAIATARRQKAKSLELQAALRLAKLYQSTHRAADAFAVLAPALEGFSASPEFQEIEQAQALLNVLQRDDAL